MAKTEDGDTADVPPRRDEPRRRQAAGRTVAGRPAAGRAAVQDDDEAEPDDESLDSLAAAPPQQANEFACRRCFLVKNRSQLADPAGLVCHDCA